MSTKPCDFCHKQIQIGGGGMANHIRKSATCHAKFQALINLVPHHDASQSASTSNLPMDTVMKVQKWSLTSSPLLLLILIKLMLGLPVMLMTPLLMMMTLISNQTSQSSLWKIN